MTDRYVLKPLTNSDGKRGARMEIDEFLADNEMTNLFLIALAKLQEGSLKTTSDGKPDWLTYYSLSSIHQAPFESWAGVKNSSGGYCAHGHTTFPTWHRPYMMLYESTIHAKMLEVAKSYAKPADQKIYTEAAGRFRLPYWDIVMPRQAPTDPNNARTMWALPLILKQAKVFVKHPDHPHEEFTPISNPLASFAFPKAEDYGRAKRKELEFDEAFPSTHTVRNPTFANKREPDWEKLDRAIQEQAQPTAIAFWQTLHPGYEVASLSGGPKQKVNELRSWETFANHDNTQWREIRRDDWARVGKIGDREFPMVSLESFHDSLHGLLGGGDTVRDRGGKIRKVSGHMGDPSYAAFDPIFWLHHNNIDRMLSLFQAMWPDKYVGNDAIDAPLYPFQSGSGKFFKSSDPAVKNYWSPGFAIPGDRQASDPKAIRELVKAYLTRTYLWAQGDRKSLKPGALDKWPKNLESSWALHGTNAVPTETIVEISAISSNNEGLPVIVDRSAPLHMEAMQVQEHVIKKAEVLKIVKSVDIALPDGAVLEAASAKPTTGTTWNAHINIRKFAFNGPFTIHFFIGYVKDDQTDRYFTKKNEVGFTYVFANSAEAECANCEKQKAEDFRLGDIVPLTNSLYDYLDSREGSESLIRDGVKKTIANLEPEQVVPFLEEHIQWRMVTQDGQLIEGQEQHAGLEIQVTSRTWESPTEENVFGSYGPFTPHDSITQSRPGGYGYVYQ